MQDSWPKHVVAAGLLVHKDEHVLLVRTPRRGWEFPGGKIELGEAVTDGAIREVVEEANVVATVDTLVGAYSNVGNSRGVLAISTIPCLWADSRSGGK